MVCLDSNPIAIPISMINTNEADMLSNAGLKFAISLKAEDSVQDSQDMGSVNFVMNPVFCLYLLKTALTCGGSVSVDEAIREDMVITCALHLSCCSANVVTMYSHASFAMMSCWCAGLIQLQRD